MNFATQNGRRQKRVEKRFWENSNEEDDNDEDDEGKKDEEEKPQPLERLIKPELRCWDQ